MNNLTALIDEYNNSEDSSPSENEETSDGNDDTQMSNDNDASQINPETANNSDLSSTLPVITPVVERQGNADSREGDVVGCRSHTQPGILRDSLEKDASARAIVIYYDKHNYLNKKLRNRLARFIIGQERSRFMKRLRNDELMPAFNIKTDRFIFYASEICKTFPREHPHTYYSPYCCENGVIVQTSGKLWWHYDYAKKVLFEDGILINRGKKTNLVENNVEVPASCAEKLEALKSMQGPRTAVIQLWIETFIARRNDLIQNKISVRTYLDKFLSLRMKDALILFQDDFARLHPDSVGRLQKYWRLSEDHLIEKIKSLKIKEASYNQLINLLPSSIPDKKTGIVLSLLPYLIPPRRAGRKRKSLEAEAEAEVPAAQPQRQTFEERKQSFFVHIPDVVDLEVALETGINHTARLSLQHQPVPIIVGPFENIAACYVILENIIYQADSLLHAFESSIEICYAINCEYPQNARTLWIFLQQAYFNIAHPDDKPSVDVTSMIGEVQDIIYQSHQQNNDQ